MSVQSEFELIPVGAKVTAALAWIGFVAMVSWCFAGRFAIGWGTVVGMLAGGLFAAWVLLAGYVYADARRRGMPAIVWTLLAVLLPNCVGFVLYFLLRKPIARVCPHCQSGIAPDFPFCPRCGQAQTAA
jgi:hypothetical protein